MLARVSPETRKLLQDAADRNDHSLSREIEDRLAGSFMRLEKREIEFGDLTTYAFCRLMASALSDLKQFIGHPWHRDPWAFDQAAAAINHLLSYFRPTGKAVPPSFPVLEKLEKYMAPDVRRRWKRQLAENAFGLQSAQRAVLMIELTLLQDVEFSEHLSEMRGIGAMLKARLVAAGTTGRAQNELKRHPKPNWSLRSELRPDSTPSSKTHKSKRRGK